MSGRNNQRPPRHWVKRPPRPSRVGSAPPPRKKPGAWQAALAVCTGLLLGLFGATFAARSGAPEGVPGLVGGIGICLGAVLVWRGFGGTRQDFKDLFR